MAETTQTKAVWKCETKDCTVTFPPTLRGFHQMTGHQMKHANQGVPKGKRGICLVDENTSEVLARSVSEAMPFLTVEAPTISEISKEPPEETPPAAELMDEKTAKSEITTVKTAGIFSYEITLPADAFSLFNLAKAYGLEPNPEKGFDEWVWDCITARYSKDYERQLVLAPLEE